MVTVAEKEAETTCWIANPIGATDQPYVKAVMVATDDESAAGSDLGARCVVRPAGRWVGGAGLRCLPDSYPYTTPR